MKNPYLLTPAEYQRLADEVIARATTEFSTLGELDMLLEKIITGADLSEADWLAIARDYAQCLERAKRDDAELHGTICPVCSKRHREEGDGYGSCDRCSAERQRRAA